jgi:hypothetical protein
LSERALAEHRAGLTRPLWTTPHLIFGIVIINYPSMYNALPMPTMNCSGWILGTPLYT